MVKGPEFSFAPPFPEPSVSRRRTYWPRSGGAYWDWKSLSLCFVFPPVALFRGQPYLHTALRRAQEGIIAPSFLLMSVPQPVGKLGDAQPAGDTEKNQDQKKG